MQGTVLVVGAGAMGSGIAQVCAQAGRQVTLVDVDQGVLDRALERMRPSLEKLAQKGRIRETPGIVLHRIRTMHSADGTPEPQPDAILALERGLDGLPNRGIVSLWPWPEGGSEILEQVNNRFKVVRL